MIKIVLSGIYFPMSILRYFEKALKRRNDIELFTVGPYTGTWIPWSGGMHLPQKYAIQPDMPFPLDDTRLSLAYVERILPFEPDLWIQVDAGYHFKGNPVKGKNIIIGTDPHVLNYDYQRQIADTFYCMQDFYKQANDKYLPYAYDPDWHKPEDQPHNYDVALIGLHYEQRNRLVTALRSRGINVLYDLGPSFDEARVLYNQAPIGLNWSSLQDLTARVFELLGMKRLAIVNDVPDLPKFFQDGKDLITFVGLEEAIEKVMYYHTHPHEAKAIAEQGYETVKPYTWDARVAQILGDI